MRAAWFLLPLGCTWGLLAQTQPLYRCDFETAPAGRLPEDFLVLNGAFAVRSLGTNQVLELPGAPLDGFALQFGPARGAGVAVSARVRGTARGQRSPAFGVGLAGAGGWRLQISPGRRAIELFKQDELRASAPYEWQSGVWTRLRLQLRQSGAGLWRIEGRAWPDGSAEPGRWSVTADETEQPPTGRASITGSPFSGTPIWFDDLWLEQVGPAENPAPQGGSTPQVEAASGPQPSNRP